jgi:hypothetical protein
VANELDITYVGAAFPYAVIWKQSANTIWNGSTFETYAGASIGTYDIPLTSRGGDYYSLDFPSTITAGNYRVVYYVAASAGSPTTSDLLLDSEELYWTGTTASYTPASDYLTTLARVKEYLEIDSGTTTWDAKLTTLLGAVSRAVEFYCDRKFIAESVIEYHDGADAWRKGFVSLRNSPVTAISRVSACPEVVMTVRNTSTSVQRATVTVTSTGVTLSRTASAVTTSNTLLFADYATLTLMAAAITAVGNGWTASVLGEYGDYASGDLVYVQGALNAKTADAELLMHTFEPQYRLATSDTVATLFGHFMPGFQTVEVRYTAGYATIPDAVQQGVVMAIKAVFDRSSVSSAGIKQERIGDYSYTLADTNSINMSDPMFADARMFLNNYRRVRAL